jgi:tetratricopeptide (TPR) repeat protein
MPIQCQPESKAETCRAAGAASTVRGQRWWMRAGLALLFALYARTIGFGLVYDDNVISVWNSWRDVPKFFTHDIFGFDGSAHSVYYRPLAMTWGFLLDWCTGGAPGFLHLSALCLHVAVVVLAYVFGRHLFSDERLALLTALLFGLHPSKVESVAWSGCSCVDGLGAVFFFASLIAFLKWRESGVRRWWAGSVALFAAAMFTKETMVCIPILIAAYLWLNISGLNISGSASTAGSRLGRILRALLPYGAVWAVYMAIRHKVIQPAGPSVDYIHPTFTLSNVWTAPYAIWWYLRHLAMPWGLSVEYTPTVLDHPTLTGFVLPAMGILGLLGAAWWLWRRQRSAVAAFLGFWFVLNLAPPVIVAPMVQQHDRYLYLSAYAFCALVAWAILYLGHVSSKTRLAAGLCVVALWSGLTWHEMGYWDSEATLWGRVLQVAPSNIKAQVQMAFLCREAGDVPRALAVLNDGLRYRPDSPGIWLARAAILSGNKQMDDARAAYLKVMQVTEPAPGQVVAAGPRAKMRAAAAYQLALLDISAGNFAEAEGYARTALSVRYDGVGYHSALSQSLQGEGRVEEARTENALELHLRLAQQGANRTDTPSVRE